MSKFLGGGRARRCSAVVVSVRFRGGVLFFVAEISLSFQKCAKVILFVSVASTTMAKVSRRKVDE